MASHSDTGDGKQSLDLIRLYHLVNKEVLQGKFVFLFARETGSIFTCIMYSEIKINWVFFIVTFKSHRSYTDQFDYAIRCNMKS